MPQPPAVGLDAFPFHIHWDAVGLAAGLVVAYIGLYRAWKDTYAPNGEPPVTRRQIAWFVSGITLFLAVRSWPIHDIGEGSLFTFHMIEHLVIALAVPPMLLKGIPWWLLRRIVLPIMPVVRFLTRPLVALLFFNAVLALLHWTEIVELMLESGPAHIGLHALLLVSATCMWWPVIGPIPDLPKLSPPASMGYLFLQSLVPTIPASFLTFGSEPLYEIYETLPRLWNLGALDDQLIAGLIMKIGGGLVLWTVITVIWFTWAAEEERHTARARVERVG